MPSNLAIVIVSWNTRRLTLDALRTLVADLDAHGPTAAEVWVVDNASTDGTPEAIRQRYPQVHLIASETNLGFAGGNNLALREIGFGAESDARLEALPHAVYLLNSDTRTHDAATRTLYDALFALPDAGVVGAALEYEGGAFQHSAFGFPGLLQIAFDLLPMPLRLHDTQLNGRYPRSAYAAGAPFRVDHTLGATMMLRREVIQQTGLFDEGFFMYCEEIDWSMRIHAAGWRIYCVPTARVTHLAGQSTGQVRPQSLVNLWRSRLRLYDKHYGRARRTLARWLIRLGMVRQIALANRDFQAGALTAGQRDQLVNAYRSIQEMAR